MERFGRYEILHELGSGSMGAVYQARDSKIDRIVALKTIRLSSKNSDDEQEYRKRFLREAKAAGRLSHPGIITIHDVGEEGEDQVPYLVMEYVPGTSLDVLLKTSEGMKATMALDIAAQIAHALHYAHNQGVIHRDIKPSNILVTEEGRTKIADFGVAKLEDSEITSAGHVFGTPSYVSPEQLQTGRVDGRSDQFSLGVILYTMLAGVKPFTGATVNEVIFKIAYADPAQVSQLNPSLPPGVDEVLLRALAKAPNDRYPDCEALALDLEDLTRYRRPRSQPLMEMGPSSPPPERPRQRSLDPEAMRRRAAEFLQMQNPRSIEDSTLFRGSSAFAPWSLHLPEWARTPFGSKRTAVALAVLAVALAGAGALMVRHGHGGGTAAASTAVPVSQAAALPATPSSDQPSLAPAPKPDATLLIRCSYPFQSGTLTIWVDGNKQFSAPLRSGGTKRKFLFFKVKLPGNFARTSQLEPGKHVVRVQVVASQEGYDQSRQITNRFSAMGERTLQVSFAPPDNRLQLRWD
jgi:serine/threonine protein kinase